MDQELKSIEILLSTVLDELSGATEEPVQTPAGQDQSQKEGQEESEVISIPDLQPVICPFHIIVDTREQTPWRFTGLTDDKTGQTINVPLITDRSLSEGDYAVEGLENWCAVERKSLRDFYRSISGDRDRFEREISRLNESCHVSAVIIEADWNDILHPESFTKVTAKTATRTMAYWSIDYPRVHWITSVNRRHAEIQAFRFLEAGWKRWKHRQEASNTNQC